MGDALGNWQRAPAEVRALGLLALTGIFRRNLDEALGGIRATVEHHILNKLAQFHRNVFIHR